jgi:hypothetical protein
MQYAERMPNERLDGMRMVFRSVGMAISEMVRM